MREECECLLDNEGGQAVDVEDEVAARGLCVAQNCHDAEELGGLGDEVEVLVDCGLGWLLVVEEYELASEA